MQLTILQDIQNQSLKEAIDHVVYRCPQSICLQVKGKISNFSVSRDHSNKKLRNKGEHLF